MNRTTQRKSSKKTSVPKIKQKKVEKIKPIPKNQSFATKKNNQSIFTKTFNVSTVAANTSIITQRNMSCSRSKVCSVNPQIQNTIRLKQSVKKIAKNPNIIKTDRKLQHITKQKAKQLNDYIQKKSDLNTKSLTKTWKQKAKYSRAKSANNTTAAHTSYNTASHEEPFKKIQINSNLQKINQIMKKENQKIVQIKQNSDISMIQQMDKAQKMLMSKIQALQSQNINQLNINNGRFNEIQMAHQNQINQFKQQIKFLNLKVDQHINKNTTLQKKVEWYQKQIKILKQQGQTKQTCIFKLQSQNKVLKSQKSVLEKRIFKVQEQNNLANQKLKTYQNNINQLQFNIQNLKTAKKSLQTQLLKCQKQKQYIRQNSQHVLTILKEQFGDQLCFLN